MPGLGPVQVDDMQMVRTLFVEDVGLPDRIVVEHGRGVHVAFDQADDLAVLQVDCGVDDDAHLSGAPI
jgi:hypothetical protein